MTNTHQLPSYPGQRALLEAIDTDDAHVLGALIVAAALYEEHFDTVYRACVQLSVHADEVVRGNAIVGLGHLARQFGKLEKEAPAIVKRGLVDASPYVRGQAHAAAGDLQHFLDIEVRDAEPERGENDDGGAE
jgi:hypothetical protein